MRYNSIRKATFIDRPNRFIANVDIDGATHTVHVKNTGRCRELLIPGVTVYLDRPEGRARRTEYDLVAVEKVREGKEPLIINMDSQMPNDAVAEWLPASGLFGKDAVIHREYTVGSSRFDFMIEDGDDICYLEVKGVTLEEDNVAMFPDAPTERGIKHLSELAELSHKGYRAYVVFLIQMKGVIAFRPNDRTHKAFGDALRAADLAGVRIIVLDSLVTPDSLKPDQEVCVLLD